MIANILQGNTQHNVWYIEALCNQSMHQNAVTTNNFYLPIFMFTILRSFGVHKGQGVYVVEYLILTLMVSHKCQTIKNFKIK